MENSFLIYLQNRVMQGSLSEDEFISGEKVAKRLYGIIDKWMQDEEFSKMFKNIAKCHYLPDYPLSSDLIEKIIVVDIFRLHSLCCYMIKGLNRASLAPLLLAEHYGVHEDMTYLQYKMHMQSNDWICRSIGNLTNIELKASRTFPDTYFIIEALRERNHNEMNGYIDALIGYVDFIAEKEGLNEDFIRRARSILNSKKSDCESPGRFPEECIETIHPTPPPAPVVEKKKKFSEAAILLTILNVCATVFIGWIGCEADGLKIGLLAGGIWFLFGQIGILVAEDMGSHEGSVSSYSSYWPSGDGASSHDASSGGHHDWLDDFDMTKDYYGKHGEFDRYDESRRVSEDIEQFHNCHPDADLSDHYYWDDILDAETDGYLDNKY